MIPAWILDIFAAIMLVVAAASCARLVAARPWSRLPVTADIDLAHVLMGIAMAGMLAPGLRTLPDGAWTAVFAVVTAWFGWRVVGTVRSRRTAGHARGHLLPHLVHGAAMVYMFAAVSSAGQSGGAGMGGMTGSAAGTLRLPTLGLVFILLMAGWAVWDLDQISGSPAGGSPAGGVPAAGDQGAGVALAGGAGGVAVAVPAVPAAAVVLDSRVATGCRIAMGVTMALMLVIMI